MTGQPTLFDGHARHSDPATSHAAAQQDRTSLRLLVLDTLRLLCDSGRSGATAHEITKTLANRGRPVQQNSVSRRLTTLHRAGLVRPTGATRPGAYEQEQIVWTVTR